VDTQSVWVDVARCSGCMACVCVCPIGAIEVAEDKVWVRAEVCTACMACVEVCPTGALIPVAQGELVSVSEQPRPTVHQPSPLTIPAGAALAVTGVGLLVEVVNTLIRILRRWRLLHPASTRQLANQVSRTRRSRAGGRQTHHRFRGG
jgi:Fe-S-cluster-containing hydrogenase component 2